MDDLWALVEIILPTFFFFLKRILPTYLMTEILHIILCLGSNTKLVNKTLSKQAMIIKLLDVRYPIYQA